MKSLGNKGFFCCLAYKSNAIATACLVAGRALKIYSGDI